MSDILASVTQADTLDSLSTADRIAVLTALKDAVEARLKNEKAVVIDRLAGATKNMPIPTRGGNLSYKAPVTPIKIDDEKILEHARQVAPHLVIPRVVWDIDPDLLKALKDDVAVIDMGDGEKVLSSKQTGEIIEYAYFGEETSASISWSASDKQKIMKAEARKLLAEHLGELVSPMLTAAEPQAAPAVIAAGDDEEF